MTSVLGSAFSAWTSDRKVRSIGTNAGSPVVPFQSWKRFKEAFAPELIRDAFRDSARDVKTVLDPFGGSGTTALAAQFLGAHPITAEVNPYLADVIEAKLTSYDPDALHESMRVIMQLVASSPDVEVLVARLPPTFVEPGRKDRFLFKRDIALEILRIRWAIEVTCEPRSIPFFKTVLSGVLISLSNVTISGKGRRYRRNWQDRTLAPSQVFEAFASHANRCIEEVRQFGRRKCGTYSLHRGDSRRIAHDEGSVDLAIFSPPYPNSFDYTDVYNVELWMLGYLDDAGANRLLRRDTLASHVQIKREYSPAPTGSDRLVEVLEALDDRRDRLWSADLPDMVGAYFADLVQVVERTQFALTARGEMYVVVGDSRYGGIDIPVADILSEFADQLDLEVVEQRPFRSMRSSPQQGGRRELPETLLRLRLY